MNLTVFLHNFILIITHNFVHYLRPLIALQLSVNKYKWVKIHLIYL